ncbi:MAG TPA: glycosyltransferase [Solirubrobacteraceae bacterium]|nr:glycosyltransferase [Solirubrobacteraceae bacterium]
MSQTPLDGKRPGRLANLPRRVYLTYRYHGVSGLARHAGRFPLRLIGLDRALGLGTGSRGASAAARRWYRDHGRPVTVVIPSFRDASLVAKLVAAIRRTTPADRVRIVVADDASGSDHLAALARIDAIEVIAGESNLGFAGNANRGLRAADPEHDVVLLNSDVIPLRDWLACLQYATTVAARVGIAGAKLLYPDNRIQYAGTIRNASAPEWFDHRYRGKPADWGPADVAGPTLAATGACMYIRREALDAIGPFDESYGMGYEDVDYCLRAWEAGYQVAYVPSARLYHHESATRGVALGERERRSQDVFWSRWTTFFGGRPVLTEDGRLRVVYVTEGTILGGGHRVVFEHLNGLAARGHEVELWTLQEAPKWFELHCPVRTFRDYDELADALAPLDAVKVATWWRTATAVWRASVVHGVPVYFVQDIETSYYRDSPPRRHEVLDTYRPEFRYITTSAWNQSRLRELGLEAALISPGVDHDTFAPLPGTERRGDMVLAIGRTDPLKDFSLTVKAWRRLPQPRPELCLFGSHPELATEPGIRYTRSPADREINELFNRAAVFLQTSAHEGFCLPILESMATGGAVVCTDAHGNRDFCADGENCLMPDATPAAVANAVSRLLGDPALRERLGRAGLATAAGYDWPTRIEALERSLYAIAARDPRPRGARSG